MICRSMEKEFVCVCCLLRISSIWLDVTGMLSLWFSYNRKWQNVTVFSLGIPMCVVDTRATKLKKGDASFGSKVCISEESLNWVGVTFVITLKIAVWHSASVALQLYNRRTCLVKYNVVQWWVVLLEVFPAIETLTRSYIYLKWVDLYTPMRVGTRWTSEFLHAQMRLTDR